MAFIDEIKRINTARIDYDTAAKKLYEARLEVQKKYKPGSLDEVQNQLVVTNNQFLAARNALQDAIAQIYKSRDQRILTRELDSVMPILLFPVRIETRFVTVPGPLQQIWLRIYPDDIHVHSHEDRLTEDEIKDGQAYWLAQLAANRMTTGDPVAEKKAAWSRLTQRRGPQRALWIARKTKPLDWKPDLKVEDSALKFPTLDSKTHDWTLAPRTQLMPDRFMVVFYRNGRKVYEQMGSQIPDTLFLGPDPFKGEQAFKKNGTNIQFDEDFAWMADFDRAVANGMGMKIPTSPAMFNQGKIDRIVVLGLMHSADATQSATMVERLVENHHYSYKGLSFVPQGTATNNTEEDSSGYTRNEDMLALGYYDGTTKVLNDLADGRRTANLLGINSNSFDEIPNAEMTEDMMARIMNKVLYPATIGSYIDVLMEPIIKENAQKSLRSFFTSHVTARGPLPAIRVGDQPYGLLVTSNLNAWNEASDPFYAGLCNVLRGLQGKWSTIASTKAVHVEMPGDPSDVLLKVLSLQAGSVDFKQRLGNLPDFSLTISNINTNGIVNSIKTKQKRIIDFLRTLGFNPDEEDNYYPFISNMVFYKKTLPVPVKNLVEKTPTSDKRILEQLPVSKQNYIKWLATVQTIEALEKQDLGGDSPPTSVLYLLLRHALLQELQRKTNDFYKAAGHDFKSGVFIKSLVNFKPSQLDLSAWELIRGVPNKLDSNKFKINEPLGDFILKNQSTSSNDQSLKDFRSSLSGLSNWTTKDLEQYLIDHLDLCSYRLDAWHTGLFYRRLSMRRSTATKGLYLGAFGWVENLRMESRTAIEPKNIPTELLPENNAPAFKLSNNAGFIHTPSLNHAAAGGLLLAGYQNRASKSTPGAFAVNLSSERVRRGMFLLEGIRNGQMLETLLGYQFERALHDITTETKGTNNLNQYILAFRNKYPVQHQSIPQRDATEVQEAFTAYPVVNGLKLTTTPIAELNALVNNVNHWPLIRKEIDRLSDTLDAANDLLLSESSFHITQGNSDRTSAVLNAQRYAEVPPEIQVIDTPRSTQFTYTNRVSLHFNAQTNNTLAEWSNNVSPRSTMEPGLNQWLAGIIGNPANIVCEALEKTKDKTTVRSTLISLKDLQLQAIDLVYIMGGDIKAGASELEARIAQRYRLLQGLNQEVPVVISFDIKPEVGQKTFAAIFPLARALRNLITSSRPASARDFLPQSKTINQNNSAIYGWDNTDLQKKVEKTLTLLKNLLLGIEASRPNKFLVNENNPANFSEVFTRCVKEGGAPGFLQQLQLSPLAVEQLQGFMQEAAYFGVPMAYPDFYNQLTRQSEIEILTKSADLWKTLVSKRDLAAAKLSSAIAEADPHQKCQRLIEAGKALLGDEFNVIPGFKYGNAEEIQKSLSDRKQLMNHSDMLSKRNDNGKATLEAWMQSTARVRQGIERLEKVRMLNEAFDGIVLDPLPLQLPFRKNDSWLGVEFPEIDPDTGKKFQLQSDTLSFAMFGDDLNKTDRLQTALIVDDWTETIPLDKEITGIAYHYNQPNATAPQSLLLAVEPTGGAKWDWDVLLGIVNDTFDRAKTRAVEPNHLLEDSELDVLLPMTIASFDLQNNNPSLDFGIANAKLMASVKNTTLTLYNPYKTD